MQQADASNIANQQEKTENVKASVNTGDNTSGLIYVFSILAGALVLLAGLIRKRRIIK